MKMRSPTTMLFRNSRSIARKLVLVLALTFVLPAHFAWSQASEPEAQPANPPATSSTAPPANAETAPTPPTPATAAPPETKPAETKPADTAPAANGAIEGPAKQIAGWNGILDSIEQALGREGVTNEQLAEFSDEAVRISAEAAVLISALTPKVDEINKQIDQLGPAPKEGEPPEAESVAAKRASLQESLAAADGPLREARLTVVRADQLNGAALSKRRDRFLRQVTERTTSILDPKLWAETVTDVPRSLSSLWLLIRESTSATITRIAKTPGDFLSWLAQVVFGALVIWYVRRFLWRRLGAVSVTTGAEGQERVNIPRLLGGFICNGVLPAILLIYLERMIGTSELVTVRFDRFLRNGLIALAVLVVAFPLLRAFLSPSHPQTRIVALSDELARKVFAAGTLGLIVAAIVHMLSISAVLVLAPFEISLLISALFALVVLATTARALVILGSSKRAEGIVESGIIRWRYVRALLWLAVFLGGAGLLFGYVGLAEFMAYQIIMAAIVIAVIWLTMRSIDEAREKIMTPAIPAGRSGSSQWVETRSGRRTAIIGFGLTRILVLVIAVIALLLPWGVRTADWLVVINRAFFGFEVGSLTISVSSILTALALFAVAAVVTRALQHWISTQFLPTTNLDTGLRNSITTVFGYAGFVLAAVLAFSATGLDLSSLALVVGALSVGIGLGLQGIVNNFVSGLVLLAERPIKAGDWVVTAAGEGMVTRISVRSTEIETFDQATVIVPNSTLITETLTNWTHRSKRGRVIVTVGVSYDSDPEEVSRILLECAEKHPLILAKPEPKVFFMDFGSDALIFDLRAWVADILDGFGTKSDLRYEIMAELRAAGIEIPFPQRDLHIKSGLEALGGTSGAAKSAARPKAKSSTASRPQRKVATRSGNGRTAGGGGED